VPKFILIVDDSPVVRKAERQTLELQDGWKVCGEAVNGREGIEKAQQLRPDVIVLDLSRPLMNGLEAARELKRLLPFIPHAVVHQFRDRSPQTRSFVGGHKHDSVQE
jgi:DNA-binding NarL/FixJ family response regulator